MSAPLTTLEKMRYGICKKFIRDHFESSLEVGKRLMEVRDAKLYRDEFGTFEDFCADIHQLGKAHAYRLIGFAEVKTSPMGDKIENERQARAIVKVPRKRRAKVLQAAAKDGPITGKSIEEAAKSDVPKTEVPLDSKGVKIPEPARPFWERRNEVQPWLNQISAIKSAIEKAKKEADALFVWIGTPAIGALSEAYHAIAQAKLYAVCTECEGWWDKMAAGGCSTCHNTGLISKHQFDVCSRSEVKAMRERANQ